jgi:nuclear receptor co-repressor 1
LGRADEELHAMKKLMCEPSVEQLRSVQKMPAMILDDKERMFRRFINTNALVEDPVLLELERKNANPWLPEEKKIFIDKFAIYNKNFSKIAGHLEHKTTADCVEFYYRNHKSEDFEKIRRRHQLKKRRDYTQASASYLATTAPGSSRHRDSNVARVEALNKAAAAAVSGITTGTKAVRSSIHNRVVDRTRVSMPAVHPASLLSVLDNINKTSSMKDNKAATSNVSSVTAAVAAVPAPSATVTTPCGLSSATPPVAKNFRERNPLKNSSDAGPSMIQSFQLEQQTIGSKGARSIHLRQESSKSAVEEVRLSSLMPDV